MAWNSPTPSSPDVASLRKFMSCRTRSTCSFASSRRPSSGKLAASTRWPCRESSTSSAVRTASLSSMIRMLAMNESYRPSCHRRRNCRRSPRRQERRKLAQYPQYNHTACHIHRRQARQRIRRAQPLAESECEQRARDDATRRQQPVLHHEVANDVDAACTHGATRADLLPANVHVEAGETDDT